MNNTELVEFTKQLLPAVPAPTLEIGRLTVVVDALEIDDQSTYDFADGYLTALAALKKTLVPERKRRSEALATLEGMVMGDIRDMLRHVEVLIDKVKALQLTYVQAQRKVAEERAAQEKEAIRKAAAMAETPERGALAATAAVVVPVVARPTFQQAPGTYTRRVWKAQLKSRHDLIAWVAANPAYEHLLDANQGELNKMAASMESRLNVAGVEAVEDESLVKRTKGW